MAANEQEMIDQVRAFLATRRGAGGKCDSKALPLTAADALSTDLVQTMALSLEDVKVRLM